LQIAGNSLTRSPSSSPSFLSLLDFFFTHLFLYGHYFELLDSCLMITAFPLLVYKFTYTWPSISSNWRTGLHKWSDTFPVARGHHPRPVTRPGQLSINYSWKMPSVRPMWGAFPSQILAFGLCMDSLRVQDECGGGHQEFIGAYTVLGSVGVVDGEPKEVQGWGFRSVRSDLEEEC